MSIDKLKTKFFTGAWLTDVKHYFTKINEIIDYLNGDGKSGDGSYKVYIALLTQTGTSAPVATVLENTLGFNPTFYYVNIGSYSINETGGFPINKTFIVIGNIYTIGLEFLIRQDIRDFDSIPFEVFLNGSPTNDAIVNLPIEIRVYN